MPKKLLIVRKNQIIFIFAPSIIINKYLFIYKNIEKDLCLIQNN